MNRKTRQENRLSRRHDQSETDIWEEAAENLERMNVDIVWIRIVGSQICVGVWLVFIFCIFCLVLVKPISISFSKCQRWKKIVELWSSHWWKKVMEFQFQSRGEKKMINKYNQDCPWHRKSILLIKLWVEARSVWGSVSQVSRTVRSWCLNGWYI